MAPKTDPLRLQAGGAVNPRTSVYIVRPSDDELLQLLESGEYCNVLCSRQTGKTSLLKRTKARLAERGYATAEIDIAGYLGSSQDADTWYQGLLQGIARQLGIQVDVRVWWQTCGAMTPNQRLIQFFHDEIVTKSKSPVVIFLDEIDSTLKLSYTDDLFVAIRSMYNDRASDPACERLTFSLVGVATPNELIKDERTTPYNIGKTIELQDFEYQRDDLSLLFRAVSDEQATGQAVVEQVLRWTGGHPYLTLRVCEEFIRQYRASPEEVEWLIHQGFSNFEALRTDTHFEQVLRFLRERVDDKMAILGAYRRIWHGEQMHDQMSPSHVALKLVGIVKRNQDGLLVVRNNIYKQIFNDDWIFNTANMDANEREHAIASAAYAEQTLNQEPQDYRLAFGAYQSLHDNPAYTGNPGKLWAEFLKRRALFAEQRQKRDEALLWWLKILDIWSVDDCARVVCGLIGTDYGRLVSTFRHRGAVKIAMFSSDGRIVITGSVDGTARVWHVKTGLPVGKPTRHQEGVRAVAFSLGGKMVLTGSDDGTARLWHVETGQPVGEPMRHQDRVWAVAVWAVAFSLDDKMVLTGSDDGTARLWHVETGQPVGEPLRHQGGVRAVAFSPDGNMVLTGSVDGTARLWHVETGQPVGEPLRHQGGVRAVAFSPDGNMVLTGSVDGTARLWHVETGQPVGEPIRHQGGIWSVAFSPDGNMVLTGGNDGTACLWTVKTGELVGEPLRHQGRVWSVAFSPDGKMVLTGSNDGTARVWRVAKEESYSELIQPLCAESPALLKTWQNKLGLQINEAGEIVPLYP